MSDSSWQFPLMTGRLWFACGWGESSWFSWYWRCQGPPGPHEKAGVVQRRSGSHTLSHPSTDTRVAHDPLQSPHHCQSTPFFEAAYMAHNQHVTTPTAGFSPLVFPQLRAHHAALRFRMQIVFTWRPQSMKITVSFYWEQQSPLT